MEWRIFITTVRELGHSTIIEKVLKICATTKRTLIPKKSDITWERVMQ
jgi:hypothetical protein